MSSGMPVPDPIANAPILRLGLGLYFQAFWDLFSCRSFGLGTSPIPWAAVQGYGESIGLDLEQMEDLHHFITAMDAVYLEWRQSKEGQ